MGGIKFGWLAVCVPRQTGSVANWKYATFVRRIGEAAAPCRDFASNTLAFALQLRKNHGKPSVRITEGRSAEQRQTRFV